MNIYDPEYWDARAKKYRRRAIFWYIVAGLFAGLFVVQLVLIIIDIVNTLNGAS